MDRTEKQELRRRIAEHVDVSSTRLTDDEARFLMNVIDRYDSDYRGRSTEPRVSRSRGFGSDGRYERTDIVTDTFMDIVGVRSQRSTSYDGDQPEIYVTEITDARGILLWFDEHPDWWRKH
jgi:hypothetical protein